MKADVVVAVAFVFVVFLFAADNYVFEITTCSNFVPPENITSFSDVFRGYTNGRLASNKLKVKTLC